MTIDRSKLRADVKRLTKGGETLRSAQVTAAIRDLLPEIERMRAEDKTSWRIIAEALASQGLTEGSDKKPLSERRLTSIVTKLRARKKAEVGELKVRAGRGDVAPPAEAATKAAPPAKKPKARLAPELAPQPPAPDDEPLLSEDDIIEAQRAKHAHLFRKD